MKGLGFLATLFLLNAAAPVTLLAQTTSPPTATSAAGTLRQDGRFSLTPTQNVWVFLLLDTSNGRVWQVHYSVADSAFAGRLPLNERLLASGAAAHKGRFTLEATSNLFTFLLLDRDDGRIWQIQWSNEEGQRGVVGLLSEVVQ